MLAGGFQAGRKAQPAQPIHASSLAQALEKALPYRLTGAQIRAQAEIRGDLMAGERMSRLLQGDVGAGKTVVGYGAAAKGNTLLNYCAIGTDFLDFTVDRNPYKHGRYTPGMHIPVVPAPELYEQVACTLGLQP